MKAKLEALTGIARVFGIMLNVDATPFLISNVEIWLPIFPPFTPMATWKFGID
jgi:hypothetical protein